MMNARLAYEAEGFKRKQQLDELTTLMEREIAGIDQCNTRVVA